MMDFVDFHGAVTVRATRIRKVKKLVGAGRMIGFRERESAFTFRTDETGDLD